MKSLLFDISNGINEKRVYDFYNQKKDEDFQHEMFNFIKAYIKLKFGYYIISKSWHEKGGIICFDKQLNRFINFSIRHNYEWDRSIIDKFDLDHFISKNSKHFIIGINFDLNLSLSLEDINVELSKQVLICHEVNNIELLNYLSTTHKTYSVNGIELWKLIPFEDKSIYLERVNNNYIEDFIGINEDEYFKKWGITEKIFNKYKLFTEYLRFNFNCKLIITSDYIIDDNFDKGIVGSELNDYGSEEIMSAEKEVVVIKVITQGIDFDLKFILLLREDYIEVFSFILTGKMGPSKANFHESYIGKFISPFYFNHFAISIKLTYNAIESFIIPAFELFQKRKEEFIEIRDGLIEKQKEVIRLLKKNADDLPF